MSNFTGHQKLERTQGALVVSEIHQTLIGDFGAGFSGDVVAKIDVEFTGDLEIVSSPGGTHGIVKRHTTATDDSDKRIGLSGVAAMLHGLQVHARKHADHFEMA